MFFMSIGRDYSILNCGHKHPTGDMSMESRGKVILTGEAEELGYLSQCHVVKKKIQYELTWARVRASGLEAGD
jgi:hypothetical protein